MALERIVKRYYDELDNGKLMGRKCTRCGAVEFPPYLACNSCGNLDTEWVEISGKATILNCWLPGALTANPMNKDLMPFAFANVRLEEGTEFNAYVCGIDRKNIEYVQSNLPYPCTARIIAREGYKFVVFDADKIGEER